MEVLEQGSAEGRDRRIRGGVVIAVWSLAALAILATAAVAGYRWWSQRETPSEVLQITALEVIGPASIKVDDGDAGWPGGLGTPDGARAAAAWVRLTVAGDATRSVRVNPVEPSQSVLVSAVMPSVVPARQSARVDVTVAPANCSSSGGTARELLITDELEIVPMTDAVVERLSEVLARICKPGGMPPQIATRSAFIDVFFRDRTLVMSTEVTSAADRLVLTPLDGTALRGLGAEDVAMPGPTSDVRLSWLVSPGEMSPNTLLTGRVQVYSIVEGTAYPWVVTLPVPRDVEVRTTTPLLTPLRNDGVDLAEVAPRPGE